MKLSQTHKKYSLSCDTEQTPYIFILKTINKNASTTFRDDNGLDLNRMSNSIESDLI